VTSEQMNAVFVESAALMTYLAEHFDRPVS
jgi:hypothetical protein